MTAEHPLLQAVSAAAAKDGNAASMFLCRPVMNTSDGCLASAMHRGLLHHGHWQRPLPHRILVTSSLLQLTGCCLLQPVLGLLLLAVWTLGAAVHAAALCATLAWRHFGPQQCYWLRRGWRRLQHHLGPLYPIMDSGGSAQLLYVLSYIGGLWATHPGGANRWHRPTSVALLKTPCPGCGRGQHSGAGEIKPIGLFPWAPSALARGLLGASRRRGGRSPA